jgi:TolB-like protein/class 3 adenylate cyclase
MDKVRQLAAILFTDIVGYSGMMQRDEAHAVGVIRRYLAVLHASVDRHGGDVLNDYGDGSLCIFPSALAAVRAAVDIQSELRQDPVVPLRIGLHVGEIFFEDGKIMGDGVNVASRIQSLAQANSILISSEIQGKIRNHPEFSTTQLGAFEFKNIDEPMVVYAISNAGLDVPRKETMTGKLREPARARRFSMRWIWAALLVAGLAAVVYWGWSRKPAAAVSAGDRSIAVLYFDNLSGDSAQDYFSTGMTEEIISRLSNIPDLRVKSRLSVLKYQEKTVPVRQIARELGVNNLLQGTVRRQGSHVLVTVQLVSGETEETQWSLRYNRELKDIFDVQSDIAQQIVSRFDISTTPAAQQRLTTPPTRNVEAYDLYLEARAYADLESGIGSTKLNRIAVSKLRQAVALDTAFADAYAQLSTLYTYIAANDAQPDRWLDTAAYFAELAIRANPDREPGYIARAHVFHLRGDAEQSMRDLLRAAGIRPFSTTQALSRQLVEKHAFGEAWSWLEQARRHDPADPVTEAEEIWILLSLDMLDSAGTRLDALRSRGNLPDALKQPQLHYYLYTDDLPGYQLLAREIYAGNEGQFAYAMGRFYLFRRNWPLAESMLRAASRADQMDAGLTALFLGRPEAGRKILTKTINDRLSFIGFAHAWHAYDISRCYAALGDPRYAEYFHSALQKGWFDYAWMRRDPFFDPVRNAPGYKSIWERLTADRDMYRKELLRSMQSTSARAAQ